MIMKKIKITFFALWFAVNLSAQVEEGPIKIFGYFQTTFTYLNTYQIQTTSSFSMQQMNMFFQKDLAEGWTALTNFQFINSFSSERFWGNFNLEEVWVRYRLNQQLNIKAGLQTPIFNNLNEINNRTPLLPYIIRPLAYETSFSEFINVEEYVPNRTFLQMYGIIPAGNFKIDYALHLGNSPNISSKNLFGTPAHSNQSGVDTTATFSYGGRLGLRFGDIKSGFSFTFDRTNLFKGLDTAIGLPKNTFEEIPRLRYGADLSFHWNRFYFESELIHVIYDDDVDIFDKDKQFYYGTFGYNIFDNLFIFGSIWYIKEDYYIQSIFLFENDVKIRVYNAGLAYDFTERIRLKLHAATVDIDVLNDRSQSNESFYIATAISVFF